MKVLVTGANGFVAQGLVAALARPGALGTQIEELILADLSAGTAAGHWIPGDLADPAYLAALAALAPDLVFHLASIPGSLAEQRPHLGRAINLNAPQALFAALAAQGNRARVVFASSIAVLGALGPGPVSEDAVPAPDLSYGAHKWMTEILLADLTRRNELDGISLRLPGIVARPPAETGHGSAFMSQIFHRAAAREAYACPVSAQATCWWMSRQVLVANLLHAATMDGAALAPSRMVQLPVLHASVGDILAALAERFGAQFITHTPDPRIEALFGRLPPLHTPRALAAGFLRDSDAHSLIENALNF